MNPFTIALAALAVVLTFQNCSNDFQAQASSITISGHSCSFSGKRVSSGTAVAAYRAPSVATGYACKEELRVCVDGYLSGSFAYGDCRVNAPGSYFRPRAKNKIH